MRQLFGARLTGASYACSTAAVTSCLNPEASGRDGAEWGRCRTQTAPNTIDPTLRLFLVPVEKRLSDVSLELPRTRSKPPKDRLAKSPGP